MHLKLVFQIQIRSENRFILSMFEPKSVILCIWNKFFKLKFKVKNRFIFSIFEPENVILCTYNAFFKFKIASFFQCSSLKVSFYAFKTCFSSSNSKSKIVSFFNVRAWKCHFMHLKLVFQVQIRIENRFIFSMFEPKNVILCI